MRLSCLQENLNKGLAIVGRAVASRTTLPITQNVLVSTDRGMLRLSATNLELAITTWIGAMIEDEGSITIPARLISELVASLPSDHIDVVMTPSPRSVQLTCGGSQARINGTSADDFPPIPTVENGLSTRIDPKELKTAISQVVFAAASDESRPVLTGVKMELEDDHFTLAAADGFRLAVYKGSLMDPVHDPVGLIIPSRTLNELSRMLSEQSDPVEMIMPSAPVRGTTTDDVSRTDSIAKVLFRLSNVELISQLIQGAFPNYSQLIPQTYQTKTVFNLQELLRAARSSSIFARDGSGIIRLQMNPIKTDSDSAPLPGRVVLSARAEEMGDHQYEVETDIEGDESKIAFNSKYLLDVLSVIDCTEVSLETNSPSNPGVFRPVGSESYVHVVMPMFVQW